MTLAPGNGTALWYITRASGVVSLLLLTAGLVLGILGEVLPEAAPVDVRE